MSNFWCMLVFNVSWDVDALLLRLDSFYLQFCLTGHLILGQLYLGVDSLYLALLALSQIILYCWKSA